jgi:argininosuccinate synthase
MQHRYADLVYEGRWWSTERLALDAMVDVTQQKVTGAVRLKLYKGNITIAGRKSPFGLYDEQLASFASGDEYDHADAKGFITLFALPTRAEAQQVARVAEAKAVPAPVAARNGKPVAAVAASTTS